jgi:hypothetical protein
MAGLARWVAVMTDVEVERKDQLVADPGGVSVVDDSVLGSNE